MITTRRWSEHVFAVYVPDGSLFGRRVALVDMREYAETVAASAFRGAGSASNNGTMGCAQRGVDALPPDDLNPILCLPGSEAPA